MPERSQHSQRSERLQFMLTREELDIIEEFRFRHRLPSRSAAVRELFRLGMAAAENERLPKSPPKSVFRTAP
jgi:hypothetical protein